VRDEHRFPVFATERLMCNCEHELPLKRRQLALNVLDTN